MKSLLYPIVGIYLMLASGYELQAQQSKAFVYLFLEEKCPMCQYYTKDLREMYTSYANQEVSFLGLFPFASTTEESRSTFASTYKIPFRLKADEDQALARLYKVKVTPEVIVTDEKGEIRYRGRIDNAYDRPGRRRRVITSHELMDALDAILAGKEVKVKETNAVGCFITFKKSTP